MQINEKDVLTDVQRALEEDVGTGDISAALLSPELQVEAEIISREPMLLCGQPWVNAVFAFMDSDIKIDWLIKEGTWVAHPSVLCKIFGSARSILTGERTALNFLQTLSATATKTHAYLEKLQGTWTQLLDTRKTIPGLRRAQKYAVACAGGTNHRLGLYDAFLIKENHIKACGSITQAIHQARAIKKDVLLEVEVESFNELIEALEAKPDRILLDNFNLAMIAEAVAINKSYGCSLEVSGNVSLDTIQSIAELGVDYVSVGAITKSIQAIDLSLLIRREIQ